MWTHTYHPDQVPTYVRRQAESTAHAWVVIAEARRMQAEFNGRLITRIAGAVGTFLQDAVVRPLIAWHQRRQAIRQLENLDDRMLADIGIMRHQIPAVVDTVHEHAVAADVTPAVAAPVRAPETLEPRPGNDSGDTDKPLAA